MNNNRNKSTEPQIDEKNKNIEARQNVTGSYKKNSVGSITIIHIIGNI